MAFMGSSSELKGISSSSCYMQTSVNSLRSVSNSLVSEFKDKFSVEEQSSPYGSSPSTAAWPSTQDMHRMKSEDSPVQGGIESSNKGRGTSQASPGSSPELLQSSDWSHMVDTTLHFQKPIVNMLPSGSPSTTTHEGTRTHDILGRMGGSHPSHPSNGAPPLCSSPPLRMGSGMLRNNSWSALDISNKIASSIDVTKSSLSLQGAGLATSHCLAQFTSDPGFAERAARFSSFSNGTYSPVSQPYFPETKSRRSGAAQSVDTEGKLSRSSSCSRLSAAGNNNAGSNVGTQGAVESKRSTQRDARADRSDGNIDIEHDHALDLETQMKQNDQKRLNEHMVDSEAGAGNSGFDTGDELENSSCSEPARRESGAPVRSDSLGKRKNSPDRKYQDHGSSHMPPHDGRDLKDNEKTGLKRLKSGDQSLRDDIKCKTDRGLSDSGETSPTSMKESSKPPEPPKQDYIHVRARRGQATDSHSLAERVRREKISERMKFLQDLVPGCSKVTGKAVMLDEIINYVQSLQRQVEFLSMKLAAVNPRLDFNVDSLFAKEMHSQLSPPAMMLGSDIGMPPYGPHQAHHPQMPMQMGGHSSGLDFTCHQAASSEASQIRRTMSAPVITPPVSCLEVFGDTLSQASSIWDGDLQSIVNQLGLAQGRPNSMLPQALRCQLPPGHMKVEL